MLLFSTYFIIVFILLILNSIPVFGSLRTRRFAKTPAIFFLLFFCAFFTFRMIGFLTPDMSNTELKQGDQSYYIKKKYGKIFTRPDQKKEKVKFESENQIDSEQKTYYSTADYLLKVSTVQALFVVLLSYWGMKKFEHRREYYLPKIRLHLVLFALCIVLDAFVLS